MKIIAKIGARSSAHSFDNRAGIMSGPEAFRELLFCNSFLRPSSLTVNWCKVRNGSSSGSEMVPAESSCVNTDWYCLFKMFALSFEQLNKRPLSFKGVIPVESLRNDCM